MTINMTAIRAALADHALNLGIFERVNQFEPNVRPALQGVSAAVMVETLTPITGRSGLNITSALLVMTIKIYTSGDLEPRELIDERITTASDAVIASLIGDLDLSSTIDDIDVRGIYGTPLRADGAWDVLSGSRQRVMEITVPLVINDAWSEVR